MDIVRVVEQIHLCSSNHSRGAYSHGVFGLSSLVSTYEIKVQAFRINFVNPPAPPPLLFSTGINSHPVINASFLVEKGCSKNFVLTM